MVSYFGHYIKIFFSCSSQSKITILSMTKLVRSLNVKKKKKSVGVDISIIEFAFQNLQTESPITLHSSFALGNKSCKKKKTKKVATRRYAYLKLKSFNTSAYCSCLKTPCYTQDKSI